MKFNQVNWESAYNWLREKQALLVEVYKEENHLKIRHLQISILKDFRTTAIAVRRVTTSSGSRTPGINGVTVSTTEERDALAKRVHSIVRNPSTYKPSAVKRVYIPKKDGSKRPLGIPTVVDRAVQAVYLEAMDPLVESNACENSFGFRKFRSAQDAVLAVRGKFKNKIRDIIRSHNDLSSLVLKLNEYLRCWVMYFAITGDSAECVRGMHRFVLRQCWNKVLKLHPITPRKTLRKRFFPKHKFYQLGRYVERSWVFSVPTKLERPSVKDAKLRLFNLDSIRAPGKAIIPMGLNAYKKADRERLEKRVLYTHLPSGTVEKICRRQKFICPACGQSLGNGEDIEVHHSPSLKDLRLLATPNTRVKTVALHKLCHSRVHKDLRNSSKNQQF